MRIFRSQGRGTIVNVGSVAGSVPLAYQVSYAATKAGILALGRALDQEIRLSGVEAIGVATILPWAADTPIRTHAANYSGHAPRMPAMDDPQKVVDAIVLASLRPQREIAVGWKAQAASTAHRLLPGLSERIAADVAHEEIMEKGSPVPSSSGTLHEPMPEGTGVEGGARERMAREDEAMHKH